MVFSANICQSLFHVVWKKKSAQSPQMDSSQMCGPSSLCAGRSLPFSRAQCGSLFQVKGGICCDAATQTAPAITLSKMYGGRRKAAANRAAPEGVLVGGE